MKFCLHPYFEGADFKSDIRFPKFSAQIYKFRHFGPKCIKFLILNKFCHYPYFEGVDFKSDIRFWKFRAQFSISGYFVPKGTNFVILSKFCLCPISKVLISNRTFDFQTFELKSPHLGILHQNVFFLVLTKFLMYLISKVLTSNLIFLFKDFELKSPYSSILDQKYQLSNLNEVLPVSYFESADLKSHICFPKFWAQIPKFCPFRPEVLTF